MDLLHLPRLKWRPKRIGTNPSVRHRPRVQGPSPAAGPTPALARLHPVGASTRISSLTPSDLVMGTLSHADLQVSWVTRPVPAHLLQQLLEVCQVDRLD